MMVSRFTPAELDELRRYDALVDASRMTTADYRQIKLDDALCFPALTRWRAERTAMAAKRKATLIERGEYEAAKAKQRQYEDEHRAEIKARKAQWYKDNRARIRAQQREYGMKRQLVAAGIA